jgi:hypothetical protein
LRTPFVNPLRQKEKNPNRPPFENVDSPIFTSNRVLFAEPTLSTPLIPSRLPTPEPFACVGPLYLPSSGRRRFAFVGLSFCFDPIVMF